LRWRLQEAWVSKRASSALLLNAPDLQTAPVTYPAATPVAAAVAKPVNLRGKGKMLKFNGTSTYVEIPYHDNLELDNFSIEFWVNLEKPTTSWVGLLGRPGRNYAIYANSAGYLEVFQHTTNGTTENTKKSLAKSGGGTFKFATWQHVAYYYDGFNAGILINGHEVVKMAVTEKFVHDTNPIYIGRDLDGTTNAYAKGSLMDVRIWKRGRNTISVGLDRGNRLLGTESSLVAYYPFDADNGSRAFDACAMNHGTIYNGSYAVSSYNLHDGVRFDGLYDRMTVTGLSGFRRNDFAVQMTVKVDPSFDGQKLFLVSASNNAFALALQVASVSGLINLQKMLYFLPITPNTNFQVQSGWVNGYPANHVPIDRWVTLTMIGTATQRTYYVGSTLAGTETGTFTGPTEFDTIDLAVGYGKATGFQPFKGLISEVRIFNQTKAASWVGANLEKRYTSTSSDIFAAYRLAENDNGTCNGYADVPAKLELSAISGRVTPVGLQFTDNTQYAYVPVTSAFSMATYTIEMWIKPDSKDGTVRFMGRFDKANPRMAYVNGTVEHRWVDKGGTYASIAAPASKIPLGVWTHVAMVHTGTSGLLYINGVKISEAASAKPLNAVASDLIIGRQGANNTEGNFLGSIDEVRVWSGVRTQEEIARHMWRPLRGNEANLKAYYAFDPADGDQLRDLTASAAHGKVYGKNLPTNFASPAAGSRQLIQAYGHAHLKLGGHEVMVADMRIANNEFWFKGKINLFPTSWPIKVYGDAEGLIGSDKLYLYSSTVVQLYDLTLLKSKMTITHQKARIEGEWLGIKTLLDVAWRGDNPHFTGQVKMEFTTTFEFGAIYWKGVKVCDNYRLTSTFKLEINLNFDKNGFSAGIKATFIKDGVILNLSFTLNVAPKDMTALLNCLRDYLAQNIGRYFESVFDTVADYCVAVYNDAIEFFSDSAAVVGNAFKYGYNQTIAQAMTAWKAVGGLADDGAAFLKDGYKATTQEIAAGLNSAKYALNDITNGMLSVGSTIGEIGAALDALKYPVGDIIQSLTDAGKVVGDIASGLISGGLSYGRTALGFIAGLGKTDSEAIKIFTDAGHAIGTVLKSVAAHFEYDNKRIMSALDDLYDIDALPELMNKFGGANIEEVAKAFKDLGKDINRVYNSLKKYALTDHTVVTAMKWATYTCDQVGGALKALYDGKTAASILKAAGYTEDEITGTLKNVYNYTKSQAEDLWDSLGVSDVVDEIEKWYPF
jgi:hypothetical protein